MDELNVKVTRVPCDEEEHEIFQRFDSSGDVTMTDLLGELDQRKHFMLILIWAWAGIRLFEWGI